jgi:uncharacterized protein
MLGPLFLDSSALAKRYVDEPGSAWVRSFTDPQVGNRVIVARIAWVEVLSALGRRQREGGLSADDVNRTAQAFRDDWDTQYQVVELDRQLAEAAGGLVRVHPLRAYDAVQLAAALRVRTFFAQVSGTGPVFVSADDRLLRIAAAEGLAVDNPCHPVEQHPTDTMDLEA